MFPMRNLDDCFYNCYPNSLLLNGYRSPGFLDSMYIKLPKDSLSLYVKPVKEIKLDCSHPISLQLDRIYQKPKEHETLQFMIWLVSAIGGFEIICFVLYLLYRTYQDSDATTQSNLQVTTGLRKFSYDELKKATHN
ncbi:hypothetical protein HYC85_008407 [Camellia sinensis]|uniref:Uncharacterized protein n=1 Tax=Camellia sinensis TaxID=4442 RepID=A0A7J7HTG1_CAMSI|nr:hypothetical protein HYC85_008407 [Camellia sinensis]